MPVSAGKSVEPSTVEPPSVLSGLGRAFGRARTNQQTKKRGVGLHSSAHMRHLCLSLPLSSAQGAGKAEGNCGHAWILVRDAETRTASPLRGSGYHLCAWMQPLSGPCLTFSLHARTLKEDRFETASGQHRCVVFFFFFNLPSFVFSLSSHPLFIKGKVPEGKVWQSASEWGHERNHCDTMLPGSSSSLDSSLNFVLRLCALPACSHVCPPQMHSHADKARATAWLLRRVHAGLSDSIPC